MLNDVVERVSNTRQLVAVFGTLVLSVYDTRIRFARGVSKNAIVLAVPSKRIKVLEGKAATEYPQKLLDVCDKAFVKPEATGASSFGFGGPMMSKSMLPVVRSGSYLLSVAPSAADLERIDPGHFTLNPEIKALAGEHYSSSKFAFVVARLDEGKEYHPFAYLYESDVAGTLYWAEYLNWTQHREEWYARIRGSIFHVPRANFQCLSGVMLASRERREKITQRRRGHRGAWRVGPARREGGVALSYCAVCFWALFPP